MSDVPSIRRFEPRASKVTSRPVVWAIREDRVHNYLLPRECPRVTCVGRGEADPPRLRKLLDGHTALVAIERVWLPRAESAKLWVYEMPSDQFESIDNIAGYGIALEAVTPVGVRMVDDCLGALAARGARLLVVDTLWPLHDEISAMTPMFSMIRMGNASGSSLRE